MYCVANISTRCFNFLLYLFSTSCAAYPPVCYSVAGARAGGRGWCSHDASAADRSAAAHTDVQCAHPAARRLRRFRVPAPHVSQSRDPHLLRHADSLFPRAILCVYD